MSKVSGDTVPVDVMVSTQLVDALMKKGFEPRDIELVRTESGRSVLRVRTESTESSPPPDLNQLMGGVKPGHIYQVPARKGRLG